jgi:hypothetical protein
MDYRQLCRIKQNNAMNQTHLRVNRSFMLMNGILAFALFAIVLLFLYISFRFQRKAGESHAFGDAYVVALSPSMSGDSVSVYLNDSLLFHGLVPAEGRTDTVQRWAEENVLLLVAHNDSDRVTPFALPQEPAQVEIKRVATPAATPLYTVSKN